jgi:hypothetical protein
MRKIAMLLPIVLLAARSFAQTSVEFVPQAGYTFPSRQDFYDSYGRIAGGLNLGGAINFNINRDFGIELLYNHQASNSGLYAYRYDGGGNLTYANQHFDYIMAGPVGSFAIPNSTVRPFIGVLLGAAIMTPEASSGYAQTTNFAAGLQLGTNIYFTPRIGLQLKAQLLTPVNSVGNTYFNYTSSAGPNPNWNANIYQFSLSAGLIVGIGRVLPAKVYRARRPRPRYYRYY